MAKCSGLSFYKENSKLARALKTARAHPAFADGIDCTTFSTTLWIAVAVLFAVHKLCVLF